MGFLWRFGSALNSLVASVARSLVVEEVRNVSPLITVSVGGVAGDCRIENVKYNSRSSSLLSLRRKEGAPLAESGSYMMLVRRLERAVHSPV